MWLGLYGLHSWFWLSVNCESNCDTFEIICLYLAYVQQETMINVFYFVPLQFIQVSEDYIRFYRPKCVSLWWEIAGYLFLVGPQLPSTFWINLKDI